jgi:hypothetical protein
VAGQKQIDVVQAEDEAAKRKVSFLERVIPGDSFPAVSVRTAISGIAWISGAIISIALCLGFIFAPIAMISELIDSRRWKRHAREVQSKLELDDAARFVLEKFKKRGGAALDQIAAWLQAQQRLDELNSHLGAFASEQERERFVREISPRPFLVANRLVAP